MKITYSIILALFLVLLSHLLLTGIATAQGPSDDIPDGYILIEGDIIVPENFFDSGGIGPAAAFGDTAFWPNGIVPYEFNANVTVVNQTFMISAMLEWENIANVDFRPRNGEANFIHIQNSTANNSFVGMIGGQQIINIVSWNSRFIMAHELGHALGLWHEQSRPDRDTYVQIITPNIQSGQAINFATRTTADVYPKRAYGLGDAQTYDFDSLMHYGQCDFSIDCPAGGTCNCINRTIIVPPPNQAWQTLIGQRNYLSNLDKLTMSFLYPQNGWLFVDQTHTGSENGTFRNPYRQFTTGMSNAPSGSTLWIQPGSYSAIGTYDKSMTLQAPLGSVVLGP